ARERRKHVLLGKGEIRIEADAASRAGGDPARRPWRPGSLCHRRKTTLFEPLLRIRVGPLILCPRQRRPETTRLLSHHGDGFRADGSDWRKGINRSEDRGGAVGFQSEGRAHDRQERTGRKTLPAIADVPVSPFFRKYIPIADSLAGVTLQQRRWRRIGVPRPVRLEGDHSVPVRAPPGDPNGIAGP